MAEKNQTPAEERAVARTGRKGLELAVTKMTPEIMAIAAPSVAKAGDAWLKRAIVSVANTDNEQLLDVLKTETGIFSVIKAFEKAATMGLQLGGQFPQAHLVPYQGKVSLIIDKNGYRHVAVNGPGSTLSDFEVCRVYDSDDVKIDKGRGVVEHVIDVKKERGKLVGIYGIITLKSGQKRVDYMSRVEALKNRDNHSPSYAAFKAGKIKSSFWVTDEDSAIEKTAAKAFLKPYAAESEGIAMALGNEFDDDYEPAPIIHNVEDRVSRVVENKVERMEKIAEKVEQEPQSEQVQEPTKAQKADEKDELF